MKIKKVLCIIPILLSAYYVLEYIALPANINMAVGQKYDFCLYSPYKAEIMPESIATVNVNDKKITDNIDIDLNANSVISAEEIGTANMKVKLLGVPIKNVNINFSPDKKINAVGKAVGICVNSKGVLVLGVGKVKGEDAESVEPALDILKSGDNIVEINDTKIRTKEELTSVVESSDGNIKVKFIRNNIEYVRDVKAIKAAEDGKYKIGVWVRDSTQGIGTVTYYDEQTKRFGALGHSINDVDTGQRMEIEDGEILSATITSCQKGSKGTPGALHGDVNFGDTIGSVEKNVDNGIYGTMYQNIGGIPLSVGYKNEVKLGEAVILSNIKSGYVERFLVHIDSINRYNTDKSKNFIISIKDDRLLQETGGIVQGMSGCPIIQNGKIIGAVTHVFVNDPTKGYGVFIENML